MLDLDRVEQVRQYGTCGVTRPVASFLHEAHSFPHQNGGKTPLSATINLF
jgi:hypothetical protein